MCLKEERAKKAEASEGEDEESVRDTFLKTRQYEQPGVLVTLPNGIQYREILEGPDKGPTAELGDILELAYTVYRLSSGAYFKYSSGGTPVLLWSVGYGTEGQDDVGTVIRATLGSRDLPLAATYALIGIREGGRRRILVPPGRVGWDKSRGVGPIPPTFGSSRRLENHRDEALLFEADVRRIIKGGVSVPEPAAGSGSAAGVNRAPYTLPAPPSPYVKNLG